MGENCEFLEATCGYQSEITEDFWSRRMQKCRAYGKSSVYPSSPHSVLPTAEATISATFPSVP